MASPQHLFKRYLTASEPDAAGEMRAFCPVHEDPNTSTTPSASFNFDKDKWHCMGCQAGGSISALTRNMSKRRNGKSVPAADRLKRRKVASDPATRPRKPPPTEEQVARWHKSLLTNRTMLTYLTDIRGLTKRTIKEHQIGWDKYRLTIPIRDEDGDLVNVRRYDRNKRDINKMISWGEGYGEARIYGADELSGMDEVVVMEGEWDRLVGKQEGFPTICTTAGAGTFNQRWAKLFKGKHVWFCYDNDPQGKKGMLKAARILAPVAAGVYIIDLDIDIKGGDVTDFFIKQGRSSEEFRSLMEDARSRPIGTKRDRPPPPTTGIEISLEDSQSTENGDKALEMVVAVAGKRTPPFIIPKTIDASCDQSKGQICAICPLGDKGRLTYQVQADDPYIIHFTNANNRAVRTVMREAVGARCSDHVTFDTPEMWTVEQLSVTNSVDHRTEETQSPIHRDLLNVGTYKTPINITARVVGRQWPGPSDQVGIFTSWHLEETQTNLDRFQIDSDLYESLRIFRPRKGQSPLDRCRQIADDMAANVTHIYGRPELHMAYDMVWHSVLDFHFNGKRMGKGWLEALVVGDTRTGKSDAAIHLARHYNSGVVKSCEGMSFAGLVGGAQQILGHWSVTWGTIPLNDRRLVVLDEVSGLKDKDVIENMSSIRSSGKAQLTKIAADEASARTRLIWISNPPDGRALREINGGGMEVVAQLVVNPEDIARFDFAMACASSDVDSDLINAVQHDSVPHRFTDELCSALVLWAWSRRADQVHWMEGVEQEVVKAAKGFGVRYVPDPPLVQVENVRMKLARIAVAIAARTFSTDKSGELVVVTHAHVQDAVRFLDMLYSMEAFSYTRHSRRALNAQRYSYEYVHEVSTYLDEHKDDVLHTLLSIGGNFFKTRDFEEIGAMGRLEAQLAVRDLLNYRMIRRLSKGMMRMEPALIELLRMYEDEEQKA